MEHIMKTKERIKDLIEMIKIIRKRKLKLFVARIIPFCYLAATLSFIYDGSVPFFDNFNTGMTVSIIYTASLFIGYFCGKKRYRERFKLNSLQIIARFLLYVGIVGIIIYSLFLVNNMEVFGLLIMILMSFLCYRTIKLAVIAIVIRDLEDYECECEDECECVRELEYIMDEEILTKKII